MGAGVTLWQFSDARVDTSLFYQDNPKAPPMPNVSDADWVEEMAKSYETTNSPFGRGLPLRPRAQNTKGLVSLDRLHRKLAFGVVRETFRAACPGSSLPLPESEWASPLRLVSEKARFLAVHTWNVADQLHARGGIRVHGHANEGRASFCALAPGGLLRVGGHADGRQTALGGFLSVVAPWEQPTAFRVVVLDAAVTSWILEPVAGSSPLGALAANAADAGAFLLRIAFGPAC